MNDLFIRRVLVPDGLPEGSYLAGLPAIRQIAREGLDLQSPVTFFVGENGSGKSTLLEGIAVAFGFNPEGGSRNFRFSTFDSHSGLHRFLRLWKGARKLRDGYFLRAESVYNLASTIEQLDRGPRGARIIDSYGGISLHEQSHGESFLSLLLNRFGGNGLYILDEPEAALSPMRQMTLLSRIGDLVREGSQFVIATHSPILMAYPGSDLFLLDGSGIRRAPYRETEHYQLTRRFLENPEQMLHYLLDSQTT